MNLRIDNFHLKVSVWYRFKVEDIQSLSNQEKETILVEMKSHLILVETMANRDFLNLISGRGNSTRFFPIAFSNENPINLGETFEMNIEILSGVSDRDRDRFSVLVDNKKMEFGGNYHIPITLSNTSLGKKK